MPDQPILNPTRGLITSASDVRRLTGLTAEVAPDVDVEEFIRSAQATVVGELTERVQRLPLVGARDGVNTRYMISELRERRIIFDEDLDLGTETTELQVRLRDDSTTPPTWTDAVVASVEPVDGVVTLSAAPAASTSRVELAAWVSKTQLDLGRVKFVVQLLAAHLVDMRARKTGEIPPAHPQGAGEAQGFVRSTRNYYKLYEAELEKLKPFEGGAATIRTGLPSAYDEYEAMYRG